MTLRLSLPLIICSVAISHAALGQDSLRYKQACNPGAHITIAAVGDILLHRPLQQAGLNLGFDTLWAPAMPYFEQADLVYGNLEGPIAEGMYPNGKVSERSNASGVYTGYPLFNYPPPLAPALKKGGFDVVSVANNHALDRGGLGLDKTLQILEQAQVKHIGARPSHGAAARYQLLEVKGFKIAWFACAEHTNGIQDKQNQVLHCYRSSDKKWLLDRISQLKNQVDAIIVSPHWGEQYHTMPDARQKALAHQLLEAGATAVIGSHPHVLQPIEKYVTQDGRETLIAYSLGNFISNQGSLKNRTSLILMLTLVKTKTQTQIKKVEYVPLFMENRNGSLPDTLTVPTRYSPLLTPIIGPNERWHPEGVDPQCVR